MEGTVDCGESGIEKARAMAMLWTVERTRENELKIITNDTWLISWIGGRINECEDDAWLGTEEKNLWKKVLTELRKKGERTVIRKPKSEKEKRRLEGHKKTVTKRGGQQELEVER